MPFPLFGAFLGHFWKFFKKPPSLNLDFFRLLVVYWSGCGMLFELTVHLMKYNKMHMHIQFLAIFLNIVLKIEWGPKNKICILYWSGYSIQFSLQYHDNFESWAGLAWWLHMSMQFNCKKTFEIVVAMMETKSHIWPLSEKNSFTTQTLEFKCSKKL